MQKDNVANISGTVSAIPEKLTRLPQPVEKLNYIGNIDLISSQKPILGIVGARKVTPYGREVTIELASAAASKGIIIASGLALGVDSIAHKAAVDSRGATIAVLPSGTEKIYPANHRSLAKQIIDSHGLLISEYENDFMPLRHSFIERNRIIAASSDVLLITEAAERSGSLHTARFALELGKTVAAVPGNITSPMSSGTNSLIRSGAVPILNSKDLLELLGIDPDTNENIEYLPENTSEQTILELLKSTGSGHELLSQSGLDAAVFQTHLTMLEIKGVIEPLGNNMWKLR